MGDKEWPADRFEEHRAHLRAVAYRKLGSLTEADDAVQDTWLRLSRSGAGEVVDAFFAASRATDFDALVAILDPDIVLRSDWGPRRPEDSWVTHGAAEVARQALMFRNPAASRLRPRW
jgi:hypothetical protein